MKWLATYDMVVTQSGALVNATTWLRHGNKIGNRYRNRDVRHAEQVGWKPGRIGRPTSWEPTTKPYAEWAADRAAREAAEQRAADLANVRNTRIPYYPMWASSVPWSGKVAQPARAAYQGTRTRGSGR